MGVGVESGECVAVADAAVDRFAGLAAVSLLSCVASPLLVVAGSDASPLGGRWSASPEGMGGVLL